MTLTIKFTDGTSTAAHADGVDFIENTIQRIPEDKLTKIESWEITNV